MCRIDCMGLPQRDFALRDILSLVYSGLGREIPVVVNFNPAVYTHIYSMIKECREHSPTEAQLTAYWAPMLAEIQRMRGDPVQAAPAPVQAAPPPEADADIEMDRDPDRESSSEDDSEEDQGGEEGTPEEDETNGAQGEAEEAQGDEDSSDEEL